MSAQRLDELVSALAAARPVLDDVARARVGAVIQAACRADDAAPPRSTRRRWAIGAAIAAAAAAAAVLIVVFVVFASRDRARHQLVVVEPIAPAPIGELPDGALLSARRGATVHGRIHGASLTLYGPGWAARRADKIVVDADAFVVDRSAGGAADTGSDAPGSSAPGSGANSDPPAGEPPAAAAASPAASPAIELQLRTATIHVQFATFSVYDSRGLQVTVLRGEIVLACRGAAKQKVTAGRSATCGPVQTAAASPPAGAPGGDAAPAATQSDAAPNPVAAGPPPQDLASAPPQDSPRTALPQAPPSAASPLTGAAAARIATASPPSGSPAGRIAAASPPTGAAAAHIAAASPPSGSPADRAAHPGRSAATPRPASRPAASTAASTADRAAGSPASAGHAAGGHAAGGRGARGADRAGHAGAVTVDDVSQFPFAANSDAEASAPVPGSRIAVTPPAGEPAAPAALAVPAVPATPAERYAAAERLIAKDAGAARAALRALVAEAPGAPEAAPALLDLARLAAAAGDEASAQAALAQLSAHPGAAALAMPAAYLRCTLERTGGGYRTCLAAFRAAFPDSPRDAEVLAGLAIATARDGDCAAALPLFAESIRRYPKGPSAADVRAWRAYCEAGK